MSGAIVFCGFEVRIIFMKKETINRVEQKLVIHVAKVQSGPNGMRIDKVR
jgi:hypothetical protein